MKLSKKKITAEIAAVHFLLLKLRIGVDLKTELHLIEMKFNEQIRT